MQIIDDKDRARLDRLRNQQYSGSKALLNAIEAVEGSTPDYDKRRVRIQTATVVDRSETKNDTTYTPRGATGWASSTEVAVQYVEAVVRHLALDPDVGLIGVDRPSGETAIVYRRPRPVSHPGLDEEILASVLGS